MGTPSLMRITMRMSIDLLRRLTITKLLLAALSVAVLSACSSSSGGGAYGYGDGPPPKDIDVSNIPNATPKVEPITKAGNPNPYTLFGKTYTLLPVGAAYKERGVASWYGNKFHGRKTSNGEIYNMYGMTAAHKTLRIPGYVKVSNLENGRSVIVRVNDRGPFHGNRIIDLSYAAAKKLGFSAQGTARVEVEAINPRTFHKYQKNYVEPPQVNNTPKRAVAVQPKNARIVKADSSALKNSRLDGYQFKLPGNTFLQAGAFSSEDTALQLSKRLKSVTTAPVVVRQFRQAKLASSGPSSSGTDSLVSGSSGSDSSAPVYKVLLGPVTDNIKLLSLKRLLLKAEKIESFVVYD